MGETAQRKAEQAGTSPGGMYNGLMVQDLNLDDISSDRRNPVLADVMAQRIRGQVIEPFYIGIRP